MPKLTIHRKGFTFKKGKAKGTRVKPKTFKIKDRGMPGRGKKVIPTLKKGALGVHFKDPAIKRRRHLIKLAKRIGEKKVMGMLQAIVVYNKNVNPMLSKKAALDRTFIAKSFIGKKRVKTGTGLYKRKRS